MTITPRAIEVLHRVRAQGLAARRRSAPARRVVRAPLTGLERGEAYTVRWRATSSDGHTGSGVFTFGIGVDAAAPDRGVRRDRADLDGRRRPLGRSSSRSRSLVGTIGLRLLVLREPLPPRLSNRLYGVATAGGIAVLDVGIAAFVMRAADALQLPFVDLLYGDLSPIATKTRFGVAFVAMTLGYALVTALVFLSWLLDRPRLLWPAFLVGLGFATGLSLSGHSARRAELDLFTELADWLHLVAAIALGRRPRRARDVRLAARARAAPRRLPRLLAARDRAGRACSCVAGTYLAILRLPRARTSSGRQATGTCCSSKLAIVSRRAHVGRGAPLLRPAAARAGRRAAPVCAAASSARATVAMAVLLARRRPRQLGAAAQAGIGARRRRRRDELPGDWSRSPAERASSACTSRAGSSPTGTPCARSTSPPLDDPALEPARSRSCAATSATERDVHARSSTAPTCSCTRRPRCRSRRRARRSARSTSTARRTCSRRRSRPACGASSSISSTAVYGVPEVHPIYEDDPLVGVGAYGESKIDGRAARVATSARRGLEVVDRPAEDVHRARAARRLRDPLRLDPRGPADPDPRRRRATATSCSPSRTSSTRSSAPSTRRRRGRGVQRRRGASSAPSATTCRR